MQLLIVLCVLLLTFPALVFVRAVMGWRIRRLMRRKSEEAAQEQTALAGTEEVPASHALTIREFDYQQVPESAGQARLQAANAARALFVRCWVYEVGACLAYLLAGSLAGFSSASFMPALVLSLAYLAIITLRLVFYFRGYTRPSGKRAFAGFRNVLGKVALGPFALLFGVQTQGVPFLLALVAAGVIAVMSDSVLVMLGLAAAMVLHGVLRVRLFRESQAVDNHTLLMLRVFGMDRSAFLTFGHVLDYWRRLGSSFTVVDPSYFRFQYRAMSPRNIAIVFWTSTVLSVLIFAAVQGEDALLGSVFGISFVLILGYMLFATVLFVRIPADFASSSAHISKRLQTLLRRPREWTLMFRDLHMYCFDNTWRLAVEAFVESADVVLMDLRGYTEERRGCEYEVDFIFDAIEVDRIVFLVDKKSDLEAVRQLLVDRWEHLKVESPNLSKPDPTATIYLSVDQRAKDVSGLLNLMLQASSR